MNILDLKRKLMPLSGYMGGGSPASSSSTATTGLPEWAKGYAQDTLAKQSALSDRPYEAYGANRIQGFTPMQEQARQNASNMNAGPEGFSQGISAYMSPYQQQVTDIQKREARRQSDINAQGIGAKAAQVGAFGTRRDLLEAENRRNLDQQMGDIQARGDQANFDQASNQFRQGITQGMDVNRLQSAYGAQEQAMGQRGLDQAYQDYQNQREYPQQQLGNMSNMIRGLPLGSTTASTGIQNPGSPSFGQMLGSAGTAAWGLKQFMADGGSVDSQQNIESIVHGLSDAQLDQAEKAAKARGDQEQLQIVGMEKAARASMKNGLGALPVNMDQMLPTEQSMARGGIVAFAEGGGSTVSEDEDETTASASAPAEGPGNPAVYNEALRNQLAQAKTVAEAKYESMNPEEYNRIIEERRASLLKGLGENPYEGMRADAKRLGEESATNLKQGKGLAAIQAAAAMLQGNDLSRGLAAGASTFADAYGTAVKADQAQKAAIQKMNINIADSERKEKMGLTKDAIAAADQARKDHQAAQVFGIDKAKALGKVYQGIAATSKPGAVKAPTPAKVAEQLAAAEIAFQKNPKDPETKANVEALRRTAAQLAQKTVFNTGEFGDKRLANLETGQGNLLLIAANKAAADKIKGAEFNPNSDLYKAKTPEAKDTIRRQMVNTERANLGLPPVASDAPAAAPAPAAPAAPAAAKPISDADFKTKWATLKSGQKLVGPDGIEYIKK